LALQLFDLPARGSPPFDRFKHHQDLLRLPRARGGYEKVFQAFAAFVAHATTLVAAATGFKAHCSITRTSGCDSFSRAVLQTNSSKEVDSGLQRRTFN
jgi:hypothetical protein